MLAFNAIKHLTLDKTLKAQMLMTDKDSECPIFQLLLHLIFHLQVLILDTTELVAILLKKQQKGCPTPETATKKTPRHVTPSSGGRVFKNSSPFLFGNTLNSPMKDHMESASPHRSCPNCRVRLPTCCFFSKAALQSGSSWQWPL